MKEIYPNAKIEEIRTKAKKSTLGRFVKQYKKGDFMYTIDKPPFKHEAIAAVHMRTKRLFAWSYFGWREMDNLDTYI